LREKLENDNVTLPIDRSSPVIDSSSENILNNNQTSTLEYSEVHKDITQINDSAKDTYKQENDEIVDEDNSISETANPDTFKQENDRVDASLSISEIDNPEAHELHESSSQEKKKKAEPKLGFIQMRIDSTIYFDNMGYSYQIQNEKNDKK